MNRDFGFAWDRVVVCVSKSTVTVLGQSADRTDKSLLINRVTVSEILEVSPSTEESAIKSVVTGIFLLGFLTLKGGVYLGVVTRANLAGSLGEHPMYAICEVEWIFVSFSSSSASKLDLRHLNLISNLFRSADYFFSPSLNLDGGNARFCWNLHHLERLRARSVSGAWIVPVIHGSVRSLTFATQGRKFELALICRRSRFFAGTRYRKRGLNWAGDCANEVELEQILVSHGPPDKIFSFKQVRASVPLRWSQDSHGLIPKPEIFLKHDDLELAATEASFTDLLQRYGGPIAAVSLMLKKEGSGEALLGTEYLNAVEYLGIERGMDLRLIQFDLKGAAAAMDQAELVGGSSLIPSDMYSEASRLAKELVSLIQWTAQVGSEFVRTQTGVIRTNCIDCLDRTNIFQYVVGLECLTQQLVELGVLDAANPLKPSWSVHGSVDCSLLLLIEEMFEAIGDQLSVQYAGTVTHKKYATSKSSASLDGGTSGLLSSGREIFISLSRHYSSAFTDADKQNATNLFLGMYPMSTDEDVCLVENIDKFVHDQVGRGARSPPAPPTILKLTKPGRPGYIALRELRRFGDPKPIFFNPTISTPSFSSTPRRSLSMGI